MERRISFTTSAEIIRVPASSVVCVTAEGNYSSLRLANGSNFLLSMQLGQVERHISQSPGGDGRQFIRIGKSLIVNMDYICYIHPQRQKVTLSDGRTFSHELSASKEALKLLKDYLEKKDQNEQTS